MKLFEYFKTPDGSYLIPPDIMNNIDTTVDFAMIVEKYRGAIDEDVYEEMLAELDEHIAENESPN